MAWGKKNKKDKKDKKAKINVVPRSAPAKPAAKAVPVKPGAKPIGPELAPVNPIPKGTKPADIVQIHMLGNAMVGGVQYTANLEYTVPMSTYKAIGKSCVSTAKWRAIQAKGGLGSLNK